MNNLKYVGTIVNYKGLNGCILANYLPKGLILPAGCEIYVGFSENFCDKYILTQELAGNINKAEIYLNGIDSKEKALNLKEKGIFVEHNIAIKYNPDFIFHDEIIGATVINIDTNEHVGEIIDIWELPANNVWLVSSPNGELPIPVIDDVVKDVNIEEKLIKIHILDGLMDLLNKSKANDED